MTDHDKMICDMQAQRITYWSAMREVCADLRKERRSGYIWPAWWQARWEALEYDYGLWRDARDWQKVQEAME